MYIAAKTSYIVVFHIAFELGLRHVCAGTPRAGMDSLARCARFTRAARDPFHKASEELEELRKARPSL